MIGWQAVKQEDSVARREQRLLVVLVHTNSVQFPRSHATPISTERVSCLPGARRMVGRNLRRNRGFLASFKRNE